MNAPSCGTLEGMKVCRAGLHQYDGRRCLECKRSGVRDWQAGHKAEANAATKRWRQENPERVRESQRAYLALHKREFTERDAERQRIRRAKNKAARPTCAHQLSVGCVECRRKRKARWMREWRMKHLADARSYEREQRARPETKVKAAAYRRANRAAINARRAAWMKANPQWVAVRNASRRVKVSKRVPMTAERRRERDRQRYATNPHNWKEAARRRRGILQGARIEPVTAAHLRLLLEAQDGACRYCRAPLGKDKHLDHLIPLARGGPHAPSNVCWACPACNLRKHTRTEAEFLAAA
jgi:hypothetical protein